MRKGLGNRQRAGLTLGILQMSQQPLSCPESCCPPSKETPLGLQLEQLLGRITAGTVTRALKFSLPQGTAGELPNQLRYLALQLPQ